MNIERFFPDQNRHVRFLLGLYISRKRLESGASIADLAQKIEVTPQAFKRIEAGRMKITPGLFDKIQAHVSIDPEDLNEIRKIAGVSFINDLSKVLVPNYPV